MFIIEEWMFKLGLTYGEVLVFGYVYNCVRENGWNPKAISSTELAKIMGGKNQGNISNCLNNICRKGLLVHAGNTSNNCILYGLTAKVFEVSKETPVTVIDTEIDYTEDIKKVMAKFKAVLGIDLYPKEQIEQYAIPLLAAGQTADNLCAVIECKAREWRDDLKMCQFIRPQTLFGNKYDAYLQQSKLMVASKPDIDISFIYKAYNQMNLTPPEDLADWCVKALRDNPDLNVTSLGWTIIQIYKLFQANDSDEWIQKKMASTSVLSKHLAQCKKDGLFCTRIFGENFKDFRWNK